MYKYYLNDIGAIAEFSQAPTSDFWDSQWDHDSIRKYVLSQKSDNIFIPQVKRYLSKGSRVLEAGCGRGQLVNALKENKFSSVGVDFAKKTVEEINKHVPEIDVQLGDVRTLSFNDASFDGYISAGVIEHFWDGYDNVLKEAHRVLRKNGYIFITFPQISLLRRVKLLLSFYKTYTSNDFKESDSNFYQFLLDSKLVLKDLDKIGFEFKYQKSFDGIKGVKNEIPLLKTILDPIYKISLLKPLRVILNAGFSFFAGHIKLLVLQKR